jgi:hypothetical protein
MEVELMERVRRINGNISDANNRKHTEIYSVVGKLWPIMRRFINSEISAETGQREVAVLISAFTVHRLVPTLSRLQR